MHAYILKSQTIKKMLDIFVVKHSLFLFAALRGAAGQTT